MSALERPVETPRERRERLLGEGGRQLANGKVESPHLAAVTAYADFLRFQALPYAGGTFEQPFGLLDEMRTVHAAYVKESERLEKQAQNRAARRKR